MPGGGADAAGPAALLPTHALCNAALPSTAIEADADSASTKLSTGHGARIGACGLVRPGLTRPGLSKRGPAAHSMAHGRP